MEHAIDTNHTDDRAVVHVENLVRHFAANRAVDGMSFRVQKGEIFGLIGPDGAGKTTTMRIVSGLMHKDGGEVRVLGQDPWGKSGTKVREALGLVPQEHSLYGDLSVDENFYFFAELYGIEKKKIGGLREKLLGITRLAEFGERRAQNLSGGMYKKLSLACALVHRPEVLLLDEPTNGVDPVSRRELWNLLYEFVHEGTTVLVTTPYMDEAARCHRVALVNDGKIVSTGSPAELVRDCPATVLEVVHLDEKKRETLHDELQALPGVVAASPAGARLRLVLEPSAAQGVTDALARLGVELARAQPDFEDVFLWQTRKTNLAGDAIGDA